MPTQELLTMLWRTVSEHLQMPTQVSWGVPAGLAALTLFGLLMLIRGARWAPGLAGLTFAGFGAALAVPLAGLLGTPTTPTMAVGGVAALLVGIVGFRLWQAVLLGLCCSLAGVSVYYARVLTPHVKTWLAGGFDGEWIELAPAGTVTAQNASAATELANLWTHLSANVPQFALSFYGIAGLTGAAGIVFGLLLPRASRALWAATLGTLFAGVGVTGLMQQHAPQALDWLTQNHIWAWSGVATLWLFAVAYNFVSTRPKRRAVEEPALPATPLPSRA